MRYAFVRDNMVEFVEDGSDGLTLPQKYHSGILHCFVEIPEGQAVRMGDYCIDGVFSAPITATEYLELKKTQEDAVSRLEASESAILGLMQMQLNQPM